MNSTSPEQLVIFDYSGTLSLEAPRFARPESLRQALAESGLAGLGVADTEVFWEQIVNPTWTEGSTTPAGYIHVMAGRIAALRLAPGAPAGKIEAAASRFVEGYLEHSQIDRRWRPILARLSRKPKIGVIIATDHYAEATEKIIDNLSAWKIPAEKIGSSFPPRERAADTGSPPGSGMRTERQRRHPFFVANSADIGFWKEESRFWKIVKDRFSAKITKLLVVDDFGFNEESGDRYGGGPAKIARRKERTRAGLLGVFQVEPEMISFFTEGETRDDDEVFPRLIAETVLRIDRFLEQR